MHIGVPREIKTQEYRVGLIPASVRELTHHGHTVTVEIGAGAGVNFTDDDYRAAGAEIAPDAATVFAAAEMIVKVKEPQASEFPLLREGQIQGLQHTRGPMASSALKTIRSDLPASFTATHQTNQLSILCLAQTGELPDGHRRQC